MAWAMAYSAACLLLGSLGLGTLAKATNNIVFLSLSVDTEILSAELLTLLELFAFLVDDQ